jgi:hypothetical protein
MGLLTDIEPPAKWMQYGSCHQDKTKQELYYPVPDLISSDVPPLIEVQMFSLNHAASQEQMYPDETSSSFLICHYNDCFHKPLIH